MKPSTRDCILRIELRQQSSRSSTNIQKTITVEDRPLVTLQRAQHASRLTHFIRFRDDLVL
jgi:hypothetical protein